MSVGPANSTKIGPRSILNSRLWKPFFLKVESTHYFPAEIGLGNHDNNERLTTGARQIKLIVRRIRFSCLDKWIDE